MFDSTEFCRISGIQQKALADWIEAEWIRPRQTQNGWRFSMIDLARAQLILDLRGPMGVNEEGLTVILHLVDQIHGLRRALHGAASSMVPDVSTAGFRPSRPAKSRGAAL
jgi:chaperone modulatory protein CbpM